MAEGRSTSTDMVVMGRIAGPYGVKGWVKVQPYTETPEGLCEYGRWWVARAGNDPEEMEVLDAAVHGAAVVALLSGIESREAAASLKGGDIAVPRAALPPADENEYYWADLIGLDVVNERGEALGRVAGHFSNGAHDVMRVTDGTQERLIPYVEAVVREVDTAGRRIVVDWGADW